MGTNEQELSPNDQTDPVVNGDADPVVNSDTGPVSGDGTGPVVNGDTVPVDVLLQVELISQPTLSSCWAASLAMLVSYRDQVSTTADAIAARAGMDTVTGYNWEKIHQAVLAWELLEAGPACALPDYWANLLQSMGPLWVVEIDKVAHAVVLVGLSGDGTPENTTVVLNNPWNSNLAPGDTNQGAVEQKTFLEFDEEFGLAAGSRAMIVHP